MNCTKTFPSVSVVIPAFNAESCLKRAVSSVSCQDYQGEIDMIIVNDCSTDNTAEIAEELAKSCNNIKVINLTKNLGVAAARNCGIESCRGEFVAFLDCDDAWTVDKLSKQMTLQIETGADLVYCSYMLIDDESRRPIGEYTVPNHVDFKSMLRENYIGCSAVLMRRDAAEAHPFDGAFYHEDYAMWLTLLKDGCSFYGCPECLMLYTVSKNSRSGKKLRSAYNRLLIYRKMLGFSLAKSFCCMASYAFSGIKKHLFHK